MGRVLYSMNVSLDGYVEDPHGGIAFSAPGEDVHREANELARRSSAFLFGRRMYEMMEQPWRDVAARDDAPDVEADFARIYLSTPRIVFSDTLKSVPDGVRLVRRRDAVAEVTRLRREADGLLGLGGPTLAASLLDLIDEFELFVMPVVVGGGKPFFPADARRLRLRLSGQRAFGSGAVCLRYVRAGAD